MDMAPSRGDKKKAGERPAESVRFAPLGGAGWEDSGYLPSDDDQSWREMEALRIGAYDRIGHLPPEGNQSWREREALRLDTARIAAEPADADAGGDAGDPIAGPPADEITETGDSGNVSDADDLIAELAAPVPAAVAEPDPEPDPVVGPEPESVAAIPEAIVPVREPAAYARTVHRGAGGVMLLLVGVVGLVAVALAAPAIFTPEFWRAQWAPVAAKPQAVPERAPNKPAAAVSPTPVPSRPAPASVPALNTAPPVDSGVPPTAQAQPQETPRPNLRASRQNERGGRTMVIHPDGSLKYESAGPAVPARGDGDADGFYAMAPGPDGVLRRQFFPSRPQLRPERAARAPSRDDGDGVYAMAPGPDGKLTYQYFPNKPAR
jgi:hypothetical protein